MSDRIVARMTLVARVFLAIALLYTLYEAGDPKPFTAGIAGFDKLLHILAFGCLSWLTDFAFPKSGFGLGKIAFLLGFGVVIEFEQSFLPWRSTDVADLVADGIGMLFYILSIPLLRQIPLLRCRWPG